MSASPTPARIADDTAMAHAQEMYATLGHERAGIHLQMPQHQRGTAGRNSRLQRLQQIEEQMARLRSWLHEQRRLRDHRLGTSIGPAVDAAMIRRLFGLCMRLLRERGGYVPDSDRRLLQAAAERSSMRVPELAEWDEFARVAHEEEATDA